MNEDFARGARIAPHRPADTRLINGPATRNFRAKLSGNFLTQRARTRAKESCQLILQNDEAKPGPEDLGNANLIDIAGAR